MEQTLPNKMRELERQQADTAGDHNRKLAALENRIALMDRASLKEQCFRVYIAASYPRKSEAQVLHGYLTNAGFHITSRWIDDSTADGIYDPNLTGKDLELQSQAAAQMDWDDIEDADMLVVITGDTKTRGGRHSEVGIALAQGKPVFLLGPREQVFHWHEGIHSDHANMDTLLQAMKETT